MNEIFLKRQAINLKSAWLSKIIWLSSVSWDNIAIDSLILDAEQKPANGNTMLLQFEVHKMRNNSQNARPNHSSIQNRHWSFLFSGKHNT